ncbi:MarR family transcriptional regulator [Thalassomonas sp. RHCl1]|uniref:MarR family winged helix-turn-helix transcriptional regulator n=1 Tax=Thalassomonas sp. RHCl1 TaxID=2995320 RepID=UPI00248BFEC9|nr:MarR family transcriptional regulator [Thalassomonas sp. RHCl1]
MAKKELIINSDLSVEQKVFGLLACIAQEQKAEVSRLLKPTDLSMVQLMLLHSLAHAPKKTLTVNQLKQTMIDESPNVSRALNKLSDKGYIIKNRCEKDQRTVFITITEEGGKAHNEGDSYLMNMSLDIDKQELEQLYRILQKI